MYKRVLVPVDYSETSKEALMEAVRLVRDLEGSHLHLIHVLDLTQFSWSASAPVDTSRVQEELRTEGQTLLDGLVKDLDMGGATVDTKLVDVWGGAFAKGILDEAEAYNADLIVMGTHGYTGVTHLLLGSVAQGVIRGSQVPVLLVRTPAKA
jgi:nucleotide-binding universal stress UspA family protein